MIKHFDVVEKIGNSFIQHGKISNRIYLMKLDKADYPDIVQILDQLANKKKYTKIFAKLPIWAIDAFQQSGYIKEAFIPGFYNGKTGAYFMAKYKDKDRKTIDNEETIQNIIHISREKEPSFNKTMDKQYHIQPLESQHAPELVQVYKKVFKTYPFPIHEESYILETMQDNLKYYGVFSSDSLVAASSAETDPKSKNVEMTDFATIPEHRGKGLAAFLLRRMENDMKISNFQVSYTLARSLSAGMNITFAKLGYRYGGLLVNNTNISGNIESMNVWYKTLN